jgi:hypothetical protein
VTDRPSAGPPEPSEGAPTIGDELGEPGNDAAYRWLRPFTQAIRRVLETAECRFREPHSASEVAAWAATEILEEPGVANLVRAIDRPTGQPPEVLESAMAQFEARPSGTYHGTAGGRRRRPTRA